MGAEMWRYLRLHPRFVALNLHARAEYKADFWLGFTASILTQVIGVAFLWVVFSAIPSLGGWSFEQVVFIYGLAALPKAIDASLFNGVWNLPQLVRLGEFDRYLARPLSPLYHLLADRTLPQGLGDLVVGSLLLIESSRRLGLGWDVSKLVYLALAVTCGSLIYLSVNLMAVSAVFWTTNLWNMPRLPYTFSEFAKYPLTIYPRSIQSLLTWVFPFAFTGFYPASLLLGDDRWYIYAWTLPLATLVALLIAYRIWCVGLDRYQGAGS